MHCAIICSKKCKLVLKFELNFVTSKKIKTLFETLHKINSNFFEFCQFTLMIQLQQSFVLYSII